MVRLTRDLIKKKSEHNEGVMGELEEISLHQVTILLFIVDNHSIY